MNIPTKSCTFKDKLCSVFPHLIRTLEKVYMGLHTHAFRFSHLIRTLEKVYMGLHTHTYT